MSRRKARQFSLEEKLRILEEARQPNTTVAEVLRRHGVDATTFYRWERQAKEAVREALATGKRRDADAKDREIEQLRAELMKKSRIIAEVIEENLEMKKNSEARVEYAVQRCGEGTGAGLGRADGRADRLDGASSAQAARLSDDTLLRVGRSEAPGSFERRFVGVEVPVGHPGGGEAGGDFVRARAPA
jgi:transposase